MAKSESKSFGYYFLNKRLHPPFPKGYRVSIVLLIVNKNKLENYNKYLIVQQSVGLWGLPKEGVKSKITIEDLYTTVARNLELELGFRGINVVETKPVFKQIGLLFDFDRQDYDTIRTQEEKKKERPAKGKIYLLSIMEYRGADKIPLTPNAEVSDYKWIAESEWPRYRKLNTSLTTKKRMSQKTNLFINYLIEKSTKAYRSLVNITNLRFGKENTLF